MLVCAAFAANKRQTIVDGRTKVSFLYRKYRIAVAVDVSTSMFVLDSASGGVPFASLADLLHSLLLRLLRPLITCQASVCDHFYPEIFVSVVARGSCESSTPDAPCRFLVHGYRLCVPTDDADGAAAAGTAVSLSFGPIKKYFL